ncbi:MAG: hypothetical protein ACYC91_06570 [Solirubrobacteraceae bacterium]
MQAPTPEVDVPTARELIEQVHQHLSVEEIQQLVGELERKSKAISELLTGPELDAARLRAAFDWSFVARRRASGILGARGDAELSAWVRDLLSGEGPKGQRLERFCAQAGSLNGSAAAAELGSELLHFTAPSRYGLWSRWVWSPESRTGALALLIGEDFELETDGLDAGYERVCEALAVLDASPEALSFRGSGGGGPFGTDVLLACTYGVYMRTVLGLKMTQEFNALVPPMAQLVRRLLGTHHHRLEASA